MRTADLKSFFQDDASMIDALLQLHYTDNPQYWAECTSGKTPRTKADRALFALYLYSVAMHEHAHINACSNPVKLLGQTRKAMNALETARSATAKLCKHIQPHGDSGALATQMHHARRAKMEALEAELSKHMSASRSEIESVLDI